jgi:hypothetical protein
MEAWKLLLSPAYAHSSYQPISRHGGVAAAAQSRLRTEHQSTNQQTWSVEAAAQARLRKEQLSINQQTWSVEAASQPRIRTEHQSTNQQTWRVWQLLLSPAYAKSSYQPISRHGGVAAASLLLSTRQQSIITTDMGEEGVWQLLLSSLHACNQSSL